MNGFVNEPLLELRRPSVRDALLVAWDELERELPLKAPTLVASGQGEVGGLESVDPCRPDTLVSIAGSSDGDDIDRAVESAQAGFSDWSARPVHDRAVVLLRAAAAFRQQRHRLAALIVRECGKPWIDADAEVCEAIDFIEYYTRQAVELERSPELIQVPGERNEMRYVPRGLVAVIAPWNFPLAISTGMVVAGLATGNAVLYKPAEQSPGIGHELVTVLRSAGVPENAIAFLPGADEVGVQLVGRPEIHTIAFTGSCAAGLEINRRAANVPQGQRHMKRLVAEMGGKNCLIVDGDADLDDVVPAVLDSAFGFAGQKCSAASRILAHEDVFTHLSERLAGAVDSLLVGHAEVFGVDLGPVIDRESQQRHGRYREMAVDEARVLASMDELPADGYFCAPTLVTDLAADSPLVSEEIFAPLVTIEPVEDILVACDLVEESPFALTGGIFTRNPDHARLVESRSPVGNLYINRGLTGAMVGRQPFGGNRLSGTGSKAGGPGYLSSFVEPLVVCENTMRHGLVV